MQEKINVKTSNYHADLENFYLQLVEEKVYKNAKAFKKSFVSAPQCPSAFGSGISR